MFATLSADRLMFGSVDLIAALLPILFPVGFLLPYALEDRAGPTAFHLQCSEDYLTDRNQHTPQSCGWVAVSSKKCTFTDLI